MARIWLCVMAVGLALAAWGAEVSLADLQRQLYAAAPGATVQLPAGTYRGALVVPAGVSLRGAGYTTTILDAAGQAEGLTVMPVNRRVAKGTVISGLTVRGAQSANLSVTSADGVTISRVKVSGSILGIRLNDVRDARVEDTVAAHNRYGIVITGGAHDAVVNCTLADNASMGLSLSSGTGHVACNNLIANSATAVLIGETTTDYTLDYNYYFTLFLGKISGQVSRTTLGDWQYLSGQEKHSLQGPVTFADAANEDYHATNTLAWALDRTVTGHAGAAALGALTAPAEDIDGAPRTGAPDIGAWSTTASAPRPADGGFTVARGDGLTSAGLFTRGGRLIAYLFHNLPLRKGRYPFWAPARDFQGRAIPAGSYEVRLVEQRLRWDYLGGVGDNGVEWPASHSAPVWPQCVAYDSTGMLFVGHGWSEDHTNVRAYYADTGELRWTFPGSSDIYGLTVGGDGAVYLLTRAGEHNGRLIRLHPSTGKVVPFGVPIRTLVSRGADPFTPPMARNAEGQQLLEHLGTLTATKTHLYLLDGGTILSADLADASLKFAPLEDTHTDTQPFALIAGDRQTDLLWCIQGKSLFALNGGQHSAKLALTSTVVGLAANNGVLALAYADKGQVQLYHEADMTPIRTLGRGDGPFGAVLPERFRFQTPGYGRPPTLAVNDRGGVALTDYNRTLVFSDTGALAWQTFGIFGGALESIADPARVITDNPGGLTMRLLPRTHDWQPEAYWDTPAGVSGLEGEFRLGAKLYRVYTTTPEDKGLPQGLMVVSVDGFRLQPVSALLYSKDAKAWLIRKDVNHDGVLDAKDGGEPAKNADGTPFTGPLLTYLSARDYDGAYLSHTSNNSWMTRFPLTVDPDGIPVFRPDKRSELAVDASKVLNPFSWKPEGLGCLTRTTFLPNGNLAGNINLPGSGANPGLMNSIGNGMIEVDAGGAIRWFHPLPEYDALMSASYLHGFHMTGVGMKPELLLFNKDGLGLGSFSMPARVHWEGFWLDYTDAYHLQPGPNGEVYCLVSDNVKGKLHWFALRYQGLMDESTQPWTVTADAAQRLAALPAAPVKFAGAKPAAPMLHIPRLAADMPIDGDLVKWRGITPQILITPETAGGDIDGPRDCSAVMRLAVHGQDLYLQVLRFAKVVSFHQTVDKAYLQDTLEFAINGFIEGFKFNITKTVDKGDIVQRQRLWGIPPLLLPDSVAPRLVKVFPSAADIPERALIENIYGVDLRDCQVILYEVKLPITAEGAFQGDANAVVKLQPGAKFWVGVMVDNNDEPGTDTQNIIVWPATYGTFVAKEEGALAVVD